MVEAVRRVTRLPLDVHLMISEPARYVERFRRAGADLMTIHIEAVPEPRPLLRQIRKLGAVAGLRLNPPTPVAAVEAYLDDCDLVLVMSVMPGFGGQEFEPVALEKLRRLRAVGRPELLLVGRRRRRRPTTSASVPRPAPTCWSPARRCIREDDYRRAIADVDRSWRRSASERMFAS